MSSYYYLMSQLPGLVPGSRAPISYASFLELGSRFLSQRDVRLLKSLSLDPPRVPFSSGSSVVDGFYAQERALRISLERLRASRLKRDMATDPADDEVINASPESVRFARAIMDIEDPLEAERHIDRVRMAAIDRLRLGHYFDSEAVFAYALALLVLERDGHFVADEGRSSYTAIYTRILGEYA